MARAANSGHRRAATRRPGKPKAVPHAVRVRMYRQGLGDCFLLTFPKKPRGEFHVLIDCGLILGTPKARELIGEVVADLAATTGKKIDILIVTHEHWDHVSGFDPAANLFKDFTFGQVWMAWTEDPHDATAQRLRQVRAHKLAALWLGVRQMKTRQENFGASDADKQELARVAEVLSFFGIDPQTDQPPAGGFGAAAAAAAEGKTAAAMRWARERTKEPKFWKPGDVVPAEDSPPGVRVYVLGPPTDTKLLFKDMPTRSGQETYDAKGLAAAERAYFGAAFGADDAGSVRQEFDRSLPFDQKYQIEPAVAKDDGFFRAHYFGGGADDAWRRIDGDWMATSAEFALALDSDTNNTSLALAFELPDGRVLLFPGDAQVGNWESWHADADGKPRVWKVGTREVTAEQLLNRTVLYKVGHHGSHNATLREKGLEMMTDPRLAALVPVDVYIAHEKKHWNKMPFDPLMHRLAELTEGRVVRADQPVATLPATVGTFLNQVRDSPGKQIAPTGAGGKPVNRPLYVDYFLPPA